MIIATLRTILRKPVLEENLKQISTTIRFDKNNSEDDKKEAAAQKLSDLLKSLVHDNHLEKEVAIEIPKPKVRLLKQKMKKVEKVETLGEQIVHAAKEVAKVVDGNTKENEMELLQKLLYKDTLLKDEIIKANASPSLSELVAGMEFEKNPTASYQAPLSRAAQVRNALGKGQFRPPSQRKPLRVTERVNLFEAKPLGVFIAPNKEKTEGISLDTWNQCHDRELRLSVTHPPSNIFEQMILWTERGILWKFPIDNEQGMEHEKKTDFADHIFLENHLEGWCPTSGPIRHFMELVCIGLSRNYWLAAEEKKAHIMWYKLYFKSKKDLIREIGAGEISEEQSSLSI